MACDADARPGAGVGANGTNDARAPVRIESISIPVVGVGRGLKWSNRSRANSQAIRDFRLARAAEASGGHVPGGDCHVRSNGGRSRQHGVLSPGSNTFCTIACARRVSSRAREVTAKKSRMLTSLQAALLGLLQGISELFPISSLGHSIILPGLLGWSIDRNANYFLTFLVATHFATALVLFCFYLEDWLRIFGGMLRSIRTRSLEANADARLGWMLVVGTVPAGMLGLLFERRLQRLFVSPSYVAGFLLLNGLLLFGAELLRKRAHDAETAGDPDRRIAVEISWWQSAKVGVMQVLALLPGFSRTGSTIAGGLVVGLAHEDALRFSFLLATPIIAAAAVLKLPALFVSTDRAAIDTALLGAGCAAVAAYFSVKFLTGYFKTRTLTPFAIYCLLAGFSSLMLLRR
jgi:undecaprenyl-diphosphatase